MAIMPFSMFNDSDIYRVKNFNFIIVFCLFSGYVNFFALLLPIALFGRKARNLIGFYRYKIVCADRKSIFE